MKQEHETLCIRLACSYDSHHIRILGMWIILDMMTHPSKDGTRLVAIAIQHLAIRHRQISTQQLNRRLMLLRTTTRHINTTPHHTPHTYEYKDVHHTIHT